MPSRAVHAGHPAQIAHPNSNFGTAACSSGSRRGSGAHSGQVGHNQPPSELSAQIRAPLLRAGAETLHAANHGEFMLFDYDDNALPLVHIESYFTASFTSNPKAVAAHQAAVEDLLATALSEDESVEFIKARYDESGSLR